jgi:hypothetical protein
MKYKDYPISSYDSARNAAIEKIKRAASKGENELLKDVAEEVDPKKRQEREKNCHAVRMVVDKCIENYRDGEYTFAKTVDMLCEALGKLK